MQKCFRKTSFKTKGQLEEHLLRHHRVVHRKTSFSYKCQHIRYVIFFAETNRFTGRPHVSKIQKERLTKTKRKAMLIIFFEIKRVMIESIPEEKMSHGFCARIQVSSKCFACIAVFSEQVRSCARASLHSPDLISCNFYFFPKIKSALK